MAEDGLTARRSRGGTVLIAALVVDSVGNGLFMPLSLVYFTRLTEVSLALVGLLISVGNLVTLPIPVWAGALADRLGALPLVVGAQALQAIGFLGYGFVSGPVGILVAVTLTAVGVRFFWSAIFTAIADYVDGSPTTSSKDSWYAWANTTRTAGLGLGGLVTGVVVTGGHDSAYRLVAHVAAGCFAVAALTIAVFVRAPRQQHVEQLPRSGYATLLRDRPFLGLIGVNTIYALSSMMLALALPTFILVGLHGPAWLASGLLVGNTVLISVLAAPVVKRLVPYRRTRILAVAAVLWVGWCGLFAVLAPGRLVWVVPVLVVGTVLYSVADAIHAPVSMALAASASPGPARGRYLATFQYSFTVAGIIAPTFFATLFEIHRAIPWLALGAVNAVSILALLALERHLPSGALRESAGSAPAADPEASTAAASS
ncbi:MAG: MFS transporter [Actinocatenispora sp.]